MINTVVGKFNVLNLIVHFWLLRIAQKRWTQGAVHTAATRLGCERAWVSQLLHWLYKQTYSHIVGGSFLATKAARVLSRRLSMKIIAFIVCKYTWHVGNYGV